MACVLCGSDFHTTSHCPWKGKAMKRTLIALAVASLLSGCAGLHVSWTATASYNMPTMVQAGIIQPGKAP